MDAEEEKQRRMPAAGGGMREQTNSNFCRTREGQAPLGV